MEILSPKEFFEKILPDRFNERKVKDIDLIVQVKLFGDNGSNWIIKIRNQELKAIEGLAISPEITVTMNEKDFVDLINGKLSGERAFFTGKIRITGNIALALKLKEIGFI